MSETTNEIKEQIKKRRTFAIISHPDAGKTTLTEKFLLYGGAINLAGSVKGKATARSRRSEGSPSHLPYCSLVMEDIASISWILRDTRISRRIRTGRSWRQIPP